MDDSICALFNQTAAAKKSRQQVPAHAFGLRLYFVTRQAKIMLILSTIFLLFVIVLEWTEEYPGSVQKPIPVRCAGAVFKIVELLLGVANWGVANWGGAGGGGLILYLVKGIVTALEIPVKGFLIFKYVLDTTLTIPIDWLNLLGPSILALFITIMDTAKVWQAIVAGDDGGENNEFLPFTKLGDRYEMLARSP